MKIVLEKPSGYLVISEVVGGKEYKQKYLGYSEKEAIKKFKEFVKRKTS